MCAIITDLISPSIPLITYSTINSIEIIITPDRLRKLLKSIGLSLNSLSELRTHIIVS